MYSVNAIRPALSMPFRYGKVPTTILAAAFGLIGGAVLAVISAQMSPLIGAAAIVGVIVVTAMMISPDVALLTLAFTIPVERIARLTEDSETVGVSVSRIVGLLAIAAFLLHALTRRWKLKFGRPLWIYSGYTALALMSIGWSRFPDDTTRDALRILGNLFFFFYVINAVRSYRIARVVVMAWLLSSIGTAVFGVYQYYRGGSAIEESEMGKVSGQRQSSVVNDDSETRSLGVKVKRAIGTTAHPTLFGLNLVMTLPFFPFVIRTAPRWAKPLWLLGFPIVCFGIVLSNTRMVMVLAVGVLAATLLLRLWQMTPVVIAAAVLVGVSILPLIPKDVYMRTLDPSLYSTKKSDSIRIRFKYWDKSWELIKRNWVTGIGVGDQTTIVEMVTDEVGGRITPTGLKASAHNEYIWSMVELGLPGWILHWSFVFTVIAASFRAVAWFQRQKESLGEYLLLRGCQITLIAILVFGVQTEVFHFALKGWWLAAGIGWILWQSAQQQRIEQSHRREVLAA